MTKDGLKIGVVGTGFGRFVHVPAWRLAGRCEVVGLCGRSLERTQTTAMQCNIDHIYETWEDMVTDERVDAISIASDPGLQLPIALAALEKGKAVFCEKPLALSVEEATELAKAGDAAGVACMVDFEFCEIPAWQEARRLLNEGMIGAIRHVAVTWNVENVAQRRGLSGGWKMDAKQGGGILNLFGSHSLYYLEKFVGKIEAVSGHLMEEQEATDNDTAAFLLVTFERGVSGTVSISSHSCGENRHRIEFFGQEGMLVLENRQRDYVNGFELWLGRSQEHGLEKIAINGFDKMTKQDGRIAAVGCVMKRFVDWMDNGEKQHPSFQDGLRVQQLIEIIRDSHEQRSWKDVSMATLVCG